MKKFSLILLILPLICWAYDLPDLGSSHDNLITNFEQRKIKNQIMSQVYESNSVILDPEVNEYLIDLGKKLLNEGLKTHDDINFFIVNDKSINAFAMLGNIIGVHTGLILAANSESEIASVLSHEIAHISQKHLLRLFNNQDKQSFKSSLAMAIALLIARSNPQIASGVINAANASILQNALNFTRENEKEADRVGLEILNNSGFDPRGFIYFFKTIQQFNEFIEGAAPVFLRTHPITSDRISDIQDRLKNLSLEQKPNSINFYLIKSKLESFIGDPIESINRFKKNISNKTYLNEPSQYYGLAYSLIRNKNYKEARIAYEYLENFNISSPLLIELQSALLINEKKYESAIDNYLSGLKQYPNYKAFIYGYNDLLINLNEVDKAIINLKLNIKLFNDDFLLYDLLAKAYSKKKFTLLEHEALSNSYYFRFNLLEAITQMDLASRSNDGNFYDKSRVDYRLKELKKEQNLYYD